MNRLHSVETLSGVVQTRVQIMPENQADERYVFVHISLLFSLLYCKRKTEERFLIITMAYSVKTTVIIHFVSRLRFLIILSIPGLFWLGDNTASPIMSDLNFLIQGKLSAFNYECMLPAILHNKSIFYNKIYNLGSVTSAFADKCLLASYLEISIFPACTRFG